jgi:hypothetical protein
LTEYIPYDFEALKPENDRDSPDAECFARFCGFMFDRVAKNYCWASFKPGPGLRQ